MDAVILSGVGIGFAAMGGAVLRVWKSLEAANAATSMRLTAAEKTLANNAKHIADCERDRIVLLKFTNHAIRKLPELGEDLEKEMTTTQLLRLTRAAA
jgi:hypothetical protein